MKSLQLRALNRTWYWPYAIRPSNVCVKVVTDMPWITCHRLFQKKCTSHTRYVFLVGKRLAIVDLFEGLWSVGTRLFSSLQTVVAPVLGPEQKAGYCVTLFHCSWRSVWCKTCGIRVATACGIHGGQSLGRYAWTESRLGGAGQDGRRHNQWDGKTAKKS